MSGTITIDTIRAARDQLRGIGVWQGDLQWTESPHLTITIEDWSEVRSPSRAERRRRQGHPQRIRCQTVPDPKFYQFGNTITAHPATMQKFRDQMAKRVNDRIESAVLGSIYGIPR